MFNITKQLLLYIIVGILAIVLIFSFYSNIKNSIKIRALQKQNQQIIQNFMENSQNLNRRLEQMNNQIDEKISNNQRKVISLQADITRLYQRIDNIAVGSYQTDEQINAGINYYYNQFKLIENN